MQGQIKQIFRDDANSKRGTSGLGADGTEPSAGPTIFHDLLRSNLPASEKTEGWFVDEGIGLVAAGTLTTAEYLKTTVYHIIANPAVLERLRAELVPVVSRSRATAQAPSLSELEALPYLRAVVQEGYRISYGVVGRLPRIAHEPLRCGDRVIPAGVPVSMTSIYLHDHPAVFPSPRTFDPQRWLTPESDRLARYLVNFGKGTRSCLGMNLARVEIVLTLAALFGGHSTFTLYQTDRSDVEMLHDFMTPSPKLDTKGVRVTVD